MTPTPPRRLVLVFARAPRDEQREKPLVAGRPRHVERLHRALLERALAAAAAVDAAVRLETTGPLDEMRLLGLRWVSPARLSVTAQSGARFAERLERAARAAFADGWNQVVIIGGDAPELDGAHLSAAFAALDGGADAVLGPARDGGYYLIGLSAFLRAPFRDVALPSLHALAETRDVLERAGLDVAMLAPLADVDDASALPSLVRSASAHVASAARALVSALATPIFGAPVPHPRLVTVEKFARGPPIRA